MTMIEKEEKTTQLSGLSDYELELDELVNRIKYTDMSIVCITMLKEFIDRKTKKNELIGKTELLIKQWQDRQRDYETEAPLFQSDRARNRYNGKAMATRDCWKELKTLIENE